MSLVRFTPLFNQIKSSLRYLQHSNRLPEIQSFRKLTQTSSGAFLEIPPKLSLGLTKFFVIVTPCVYVGGMISMKGASLLEDYDIFVPEDEDD